ncbi:MAG: hypothetical protein JWO58_3026 [Chitinophagaceae bacterium]|nr:hypothetical protein [Chitinophagaceae bacterium]
MKTIFLTLSFFFTFCNILKAQDWSWRQLGDLLGNGNVLAAVSDQSGNIYFAGNLFDSSNKNYVAKWDGTSWSELGTQTNPFHPYSTIYTMTIDKNDNIYAAVSYIEGLDEGTHGYEFVAKWDGTSWSEVGTGNDTLNTTGNPSENIFSTIYAVITDNDGNVYATGSFLNSNGYAYVAKWDGAHWSELGIGANALNANDQIRTLAIDNTGNIYAAGRFTDSNNKLYVAKWDGTTWSELGLGSNALNADLPNDILALETDNNGNVYAAGQFKNTNGYRYVAKWDGTSWSELGSESTSLNFNSDIWTVKSDPTGNIYVGGQFEDSNHLTYIAKWNGTTWDTLGSGTNALNSHGTTNAILLNQSSNIFVPATATGEDGYLHYYLAEWEQDNVTAIDQSNNVSTIQIYPNPCNGKVNMSLPDDGQVNVYNGSGNLIFTQQVNIGNSSIDLSNFTSSIYTLLFNGQHTSYAPVKLVKE